MPQTNYSLRMPSAYPGNFSATGANKARAFVNKDVTEIPFGYAVFRVAASPTSLGSFDVSVGRNATAGLTVPDFIGVCVRDGVFENADALSGGTPRTGVRANERGNLGYQDPVMVVLDDGVVATPEASVYVRLAANGAGTEAGHFAIAADGVNTIQITNARWVGRSTTIDGVTMCALELNLP